MGNDKLNQKDEEMTTIVSIDEISESDNKIPVPSQLFTEEERKLIADSCCTKKSINPCIQSTIVLFVPLLVILLISIIPAYVAFKFYYNPSNNLGLFLPIIMFIPLLFIEFVVLVVLGFILCCAFVIFVYVYKYFLIDNPCNYEFVCPIVERRRK